jgi:hypothetical protein
MDGVDPVDLAPRARRIVVHRLALSVMPGVMPRWSGPKRPAVEQGQLAAALRIEASDGWEDAARAFTLAPTRGESPTSDTPALSGGTCMVAISSDGTPIDMGAITQLLQELRIDHVTIQGILTSLESGASRVENFDLPQVPQDRFGTLDNGTSLGHHTELARRAVREAILTMVADLHHYNDGVETFRKGVNVADEHARADLDHIAMEIGSVRSDSEGGFDK